jgi:hypothetical protein
MHATASLAFVYRRERLKIAGFAFAHVMETRERPDACDFGHHFQKQQRRDDCKS